MDDWLNHRYRSTETPPLAPIACHPGVASLLPLHVLACLVSVQVRTLECCLGRCRLAAGGEF